MNIYKSLVVLLLLHCFSCFADMPYTSLDERIAQADLVAVGEIISIVAVKFPSEAVTRKVAIVDVQETVKGQVVSPFILVSIGVITPNGISNSQELVVKVGSIGKWLLQKEETGLYRMNRPDNFIVIND